MTSWNEELPNNITKIKTLSVLLTKVSKFYHRLHFSTKFHYFNNFVTPFSLQDVQGLIFRRYNLPKVYISSSQRCLGLGDPKNNIRNSNSAHKSASQSYILIDSNKILRKHRIILCYNLQCWISQPFSSATNRLLWNRFVWKFNYLFHTRIHHVIHLSIVLNELACLVFRRMTIKEKFEKRKSNDWFFNFFLHFCTRTPSGTIGILIRSFALYIPNVLCRVP